MPKHRRHVVSLNLKRSSRVALVSEQLDDDEPFAKYLDKLLTLARLGNTDVERITGIDNRTIQKWRKGNARPTIPPLRQFADGMKMPRTTVFIRAEILEPEDLDLDELYIRLAEGIARLPEKRRREHESHLRILLHIIETEIAQGETGEVADHPDKKTG